MSKVTRQTMLIFGSNAGGSDIGEFGSLALGSPTYSQVIATIQSLPNWGTGWAGATVNTWRPALEDMNAYCYVTSYGMCYLYEMGIPEWDTGTVYYQNSYCQVSGTIYYSLQDGNQGKSPASNPTYWANGIKNAIPSGGIIMWSGSIATIPSGWYLCDGSNGTPDLRDRFIVGASVDDGGVAKTIMTDGSTKTQSGTSNFAAHTHTENLTGDDSTQTGSYVNGTNNGPHNRASNADTASAGSGTVTYPPYYALAFIQKA